MCEHFLLVVGKRRKVDGDDKHSDVSDNAIDVVSIENRGTLASRNLIEAGMTPGARLRSTG